MTLPRYVPNEHTTCTSAVQAFQLLAIMSWHLMVIIISNICKYQVSLLHVYTQNSMCVAACIVNIAPVLNHGGSLALYGMSTQSRSPGHRAFYFIISSLLVVVVK